MKPLAIAIAATLGALTLATPADAARLRWQIEYTGWWAADGGGSISGQFIANQEDALDGIISIDEMTSWLWNWTGNDVVPAFSISSVDTGASTDGFFPRFYVDGTPNQPFDFNLDPNLDQGAFTAGDYYLDLEFLRVESLLANLVSQGNPELMGTITVSDPTVVPEPTAIFSLLAIAGLATTLKRQKRSLNI